MYLHACSLPDSFVGEPNLKVRFFMSYDSVERDEDEIVYEVSETKKGKAPVFQVRTSFLKKVK